MSKVITFSTKFPSYHPKKGEPTFFVEKMINWYWNQPENKYHSVADMFFDFNGDKWAYGQIEEWISENINPDIKDFKGHTIRSGHSRKVGDKFSPRIWTGRPYFTPQLIILPDLEIKKLYNFELREGVFTINKRDFDGEVESHYEKLEALASNDGLSTQDLLDWFKYPKPFSGQIICWNEKINY